MQNLAKKIKKGVFYALVAVLTAGSLGVSNVKALEMAGSDNSGQAQINADILQNAKTKKYQTVSDVGGYYSIKVPFNWLISNDKYGCHPGLKSKMHIESSDAIKFYTQGDPIPTYYGGSMALSGSVLDLNHQKTYFGGKPLYNIKQDLLTISGVHPINGKKLGILEEGTINLGTRYVATYFKVRRVTKYVEYLAIAKDQKAGVYYIIGLSFDESIYTHKEAKLMFEDIASSFK